MKINIELDLDDEADKHQFDLYYQASGMYRALCDIGGGGGISYSDYAISFRNELKYNDKLTASQYKVYDDLQTQFWKLMEDHKIDLDL